MGDTQINDTHDDVLSVEHTPAHASPSRGGSASRTMRSWSYKKQQIVTYLFYLGVVAVSLLMRMVHLNYSDKGTPIFDEKHYAPQAQQMLHIHGGVEQNPGYGLVVHPPLGKWLIAAGESIAGYTPLGWRLSSVIASCIIIAAIVFIVHVFTHSFAAATLAAVVANTEGVIHTMGRTAMLDIFMAMFITLIFLCVVMDYTTHRTRSFHRRWWLLGAGIFSGLAMSVKMSGMYYPAVCGVVMVLAVAWSTKKVMPTVRALGMGLVFFLVVPLGIFIMSWLPWFASESSPYRHSAESETLSHTLPEWLSNIMPDSVNSFMSYQIGVMKFHTSLKSGDGFDNVHPWESKPDQWLVGDRPMLFHSVEGPFGDVINVYLLGNLALWTLVIPLALACTYHIIRHKSIPFGMVLLGLLVGIVPWFITYDRQQYFFYATSFAMFMIVGIVLWVHSVSRLISRHVSGTTFMARILPFAPHVVYGAVITIAFAIYSPWYYGYPITSEHNDSLIIKQSWEPLKEKESTE